MMTTFDWQYHQVAWDSPEDHGAALFIFGASFATTLSRLRYLAMHTHSDELRGLLGNWV
jgi:hypothetical protein